jgi:hypothetical protein
MAILRERGAQSFSVFRSFARIELLHSSLAAQLFAARRKSDPGTIDGWTAELYLARVTKEKQPATR